MEGTPSCMIKNKIVNEQSELFKHLITKVMSLQCIKEVPDKLPINWPKRHDEIKFVRK